MYAKMTLPEIFFGQAARLSEKTAFYYCHSRDQKWVSMTWKRYLEEVSSLAVWLQRQGIEKGSKVALLSPNRPEWIISDLAILSVGAISVPIYPNSSAGDVQFVLEHSEADTLIVDSLERIQYLDKSKLKAIATFEKSSKKQAENFAAPIFSFAGILQNLQPDLKAPVAVSADDIATIIYTSGTTGRPKGVVHTHGNLTHAVKPIYQVLKNPDERQEDRFFSFLPLSHVAERMLVEVGSIVTGSEVAFSRSVDTLAEDLQRCQPTILLCVPRLWEKIYEKVQSGVLVASPLKRRVFSAALRLGAVRIEGDRMFRTKKQGLATSLSDALVGNKLRAKLGLNRCRMLITGAAPTRPEVMRFFASFGMVIREVYGLTENLCLGVLNEPDLSVIGSCGKVFLGNEMRIAQDGEIMFRAPWMFKGYFKNPEATHEVLTADAWFATGDLGNIDAEQRLRIVGRKKELLKTSGGKYVAPVPIEDSLKALPLIKEALVVGDTRNYCVALVTLDDDFTAKTAPGKIKEELARHVKQVNQSLANFETIKRLGVMKEGFSIENGSLTPTLKVKRNFITKAKESFIDILYHSDDTVVYEH